MPGLAAWASNLSAGTYGAQHFRQWAPLGRTLRDREALGAGSARLCPGPSRFRRSTRRLRRGGTGPPWHGVAPEPSEPWSTSQYAIGWRRSYKTGRWAAGSSLGTASAPGLAVHMAASMGLRTAPTASGLVLTGAPLAPAPEKRRARPRSPIAPDGHFTGRGSSLTTAWSGCDGAMGRTSTNEPAQLSRSPCESGGRDG